MFDGEEYVLDLTSFNPSGSFFFGCGASLQQNQNMKEVEFATRVSERLFSDRNNRKHRRKCLLEAWIKSTKGAVISLIREPLKPLQVTLIANSIHPCNSRHHDC